MGIELIDCEATILREVADDRMKRADIASTYGMALRSSECDAIDWTRVNEAIVARWSMAGLRWIKDRAWKLAG